MEYASETRHYGLANDLPFWTFSVVYQGEGGFEWIVGF
jgi:hypothetical protein